MFSLAFSIKHSELFDPYIQTGLNIIYTKPHQEMCCMLILVLVLWCLDQFWGECLFKWFVEVYGSTTCLHNLTDGPGQKSCPLQKWLADATICSPLCENGIGSCDWEEEEEKKMGGKFFNLPTDFQHRLTERSRRVRIWQGAASVFLPLLWILLHSQCQHWCDRCSLPLWRVYRCNHVAGKSAGFIQGFMFYCQRH